MSNTEVLRVRQWSRRRTSASESGPGNERQLHARTPDGNLRVDHDLRFGERVSLDQLWDLSVAWYGNRITVESRRPAPDEMVEIFAGIGLEGPLWNPHADTWGAL